MNQYSLNDNLPVCWSTNNYQINKNTDCGRTMLPKGQKHRVGTHNVTKRTKTHFSGPFFPLLYR